ncbi:TlpA family protein disulfide reductase [Inquilinus sp. KBS0705]|nr:TlpA family protein disulfide reductase [Inquilinus sp. KBS0705]
MKKLITLLLCLSTALNTYAQFRLSGNTGGVKTDSVYLNIPFIYGFYHDNDIAIAVDSKGNFSKTIYLPKQKFATLNIEGKHSSLLLTPGKSLDIRVNTADTTISNFKGTSAAENSLLAKLHLDDIPFFSKGGNNPYVKLTLPQLQQQVVQPWMAMRDENIKLIRSSALSQAYKNLIEQEVRAFALTQLNDFARGILETGRKQIFEFVLSVYQDAPLMASALPAGPRYYNFANSYIGYYETLAFQGLSDEQMKDPKTYIKYFNIRLDSGNRVAKEKGKLFVNWIVVHNQFDKRIAENWLAQAIDTKCLSKDIAEAKPLLSELKNYYPKSEYLLMLTVKVKQLETLLAKNADNKEIQIADGYNKMTSIYQAISKFKGKVVYLDIWGTWCGPCKQEIKYNPALKQYFKGKDVAFVYLDMDDDEKDGKWRDFIKVNGMTGLHLRKSRSDIQPFWDELMPKGDDTRYYPMYFIFDKTGKLVQPNAKRPSDKEELYKQIAQYL